MKKIIGLNLLLLFFTSCSGFDGNELKTGAEQPGKYFPLLKDKNVALVVNHTSVVNGRHLVDFLLENGIEVKKIFAPEHGFRGNAANGEVVKDDVDLQTGIPIVSLYGKNKKPLPDQLRELDVVVFDIQDVGCRFYTYISTLHLVIEACTENNKPLIIFDRPNPNGDYISGPVLEKEFHSFVGMDPIPVVHGCTVGELAQMIIGEGWINTDKLCQISVIPVDNYNHLMAYSLPIAPSPNLPNDLAVRLYPSLCFFEATSVSVGRGTPFPFQVLGVPDPEFGKFTFIPKSIPGVAVNPTNEGKVCYGIDLRELNDVPEFTLKYFLDFYQKFENEKEFLTRESWLNLLAGTDDLIEQIRQGKREKEIINSWQPAIEKYKKMRRKYLLYSDFE